MKNLGIIRQDLYHVTEILKWVWEQDCFKISKAAISKNGKKSLSLTRSRFFTEHGRIRIVLNTDLLVKDGFTPKPVDETGLQINAEKKSISKQLNTLKNHSFFMPIFTFNYNLQIVINSILKTFVRMERASKVNPFFRPPIHGDSIKIQNRRAIMEIEYEERVYKDIPNLGKYIRAFEFNEEDFEKYQEEEEFHTYLKKYPHIIIRIDENARNYFPKDIDKETISSATN